MRTIQAEETRAAQRGFFLITGAKIWFLVAGTILNIGLPRFLGDPARFGDFAVVNTLVSIVNMVIIIGAVQVVSKRVSENPAHAFIIRRKAMRLLLWVGGITSLVLLLGAASISEFVFRDAGLAEYLAIGALIPFFYGVYGVMIGILNGFKLFAKQALFDVVFATLKVGLMVGLVIAGLGVAGAFFGFVIAAGAIMALAWWYTRRLVRTEGGPTGSIPLVAFLLQVMGYTLCVNVLIQVDVLVIKAATLEPVLHALGTSEGQSRLSILAHTLHIPNEGLAEILATESTATLAGFYRAAKNVSLISYQAVIAITFVIFPLISRSTFDADKVATQTYIRQTFRVAALLVVFIATMIAVGEAPMVTLLFGAQYAYVTPALLPLLGAMACFAILFVVGNILTAGGRPMDALGLALLAALLQVSALVSIVSSTEATPEVLKVSAIVTLAAIAPPLVLACWLVRYRFQASLPLLSVGRAVVAAAAAIASASLIHTTGFGGVFLRCGIGCLSFLASMIVLGEIGRAELGLLKRMFGRRT